MNDEQTVKQALKTLKKITNLLEIAEEQNVPNKSLFTAFFLSRFPDNGSNAYIKEWCQRFKSIDPESTMDDKSLFVYRTLIGMSNMKNGI